MMNTRSEIVGTSLVRLLAGVSVLVFAGMIRAQVPVTSGLVVQLDADAGVVQSGPTGYGGLPRVAVWQDQAALGGANDAAQIDVQRQPVLDPSVAGLNNRPALYFEGTVDGDTVLDFLDISGVGSNFTSAATLFIVAQLDPSRESPVNYTLYATGSADNWWRFSSGAGYISTFRSPRFEGVLPAGGAPGSGSYIFEIVSAADYLYSENGVLVNTGSLVTGGARTFATGANHRIGWDNVSAQNPKAFPGWVAEVLVYDRELTASERDLVGFYLQEKYTLLGDYPPSCPVCESFIDDVQAAVCSAATDTVSYQAMGALLSSLAASIVPSDVCVSVAPGAGGEAACEAYISMLLRDEAVCLLINEALGQ